MLHAIGALKKISNEALFIGIMEFIEDTKNRTCGMMMLLIQKGSDEPDFGSFRVDSKIFVMNFDIIGVNIENKMWALFK